MQIVQCLQLSFDRVQGLEVFMEMRWRYDSFFPIYLFVMCAWMCVSDSLKLSIIRVFASLPASTPALCDFFLVIFDLSYFHCDAYIYVTFDLWHDCFNVASWWHKHGDSLLWGSIETNIGHLQVYCLAKDLGTSSWCDYIPEVISL